MSNKSESAYQSAKNRMRFSSFMQKVLTQADTASLKCEDTESESSQSIYTSHSNASDPFQTRYEVGEVIGEGTNALVRKCHRISDGSIFAVKVSQIEQEHVPCLRELFNAVKGLRHSSVVGYHEIFLNLKRRACHLVMDYVEHPQLSSFITPLNPKKAPLSEVEIRRITWQVLKAVGYLHERRICHRDIKPDNILYDRTSGKIWLIDFGVSKVLEQGGCSRDMLTNTGTTHYKAPELFEGGKYTESVDLWGVGVVLYEMVEKKPAFSKGYLLDTIQSIRDVSYSEGEVWRNMSPHARDLLHGLIAPNLARLTVQNALKADWFNETRVDTEHADVAPSFPQPIYTPQPSKSTSYESTNSLFSEFHSSFEQWMLRKDSESEQSQI